MADDVDSAEATAAPAPDGAPRIANLDILRGIAILGILFMNINSMGAASLVGRWPAVIGWTTLDRIAWFARQILADGTARCMLELLFGAGMLILTDRSATSAGWLNVTRRYYIRNLVLVAFGLAHVFLLLWFGDILHIYGLAALIAFWFRKLPAQWLIAIGLLYATSTLVMGSVGIWSVARENVLVADAAEHRAVHQPLSRTEREAVRSNHGWHRQIRRNHAEIAREDRNRTTSWRRWSFTMTGIWRAAIGWRWALFGIGEALATMLIGAGLFKLGILQGRRSAAFYVRLAIVAYLVGGTIRAVAAWQTSDFGDGISIEWNLREVGRLSMTLGHIGLVSLLLASGWGRRLLAPFKAAGRTALTIYICQTLICLWVLFPPFALGLYGKMGWVGLMATAAGIDLALLGLANLWVRHFRIAPVEWAWRSIVEWRVLPFRRVQPNR